MAPIQDYLLKISQGDSALNQLIQTAISKGVTEDELISRSLSASSTKQREIKLLKDIYTISGSNGDLSLRLLDNDDVKTIADVAYRFYSVEASSIGLDDDSWAPVRVRLFQKEPMAALRSTIEAGSISIPAPLTFEEVTDFFKIAASAGFNMKEQPITNLFKDEGSEIYLKMVQKDHRPVLRSFLANLQRLRIVVSIAEDIEVLLKVPYSSAAAIARVSQQDFIDKLAEFDVPDYAAQEIHQKASLVERRNEQIWIDILKQRNTTTLTPIAPKKNPPPGEDVEINLTTLFEDMDAVETDEAYSVLSLSAYFVDLCTFLKSCSVGYQKSLFDHIQERRADILWLQLSKANTFNMVQYLDLANEVMEAWVGKESGILKPSKPYVNDEIEGDSAPSSSNTLWGVYEKPILKSVFPMSHFPYNHATNTFREVLKAVDVPWYETLLVTHRSVDGEQQDDQELKSLISQAEKRRLSAEYLRLSHEDFIVITKESYYSYEHFNYQWPTQVYDNFSYQTQIGLKSPAEYWGLQASLPMKDVGKLVSPVRDQLLPRLGIDLQSLLEILRTRFIGKRLVITSTNEEGKYTEAYKDMELKLSPLATYKEEDPEVQYLVLGELQRFVRLYKKVGLDIAVLDEALQILSSLVLGDVLPNSHPIINPEILANLAAIQELSKVTKVDTQQLLPLWGTIETEGPKSLGAKLFKKTRPPPSILELSSQTDTFDDHLNVVQNALRLKSKDFFGLSEITGITTSSPWTIENVTMVYRYNTFCSVLGITPGEYSAWVSFMKVDSRIFLEPIYTLGIVTSWRKIIDSGYSVTEILVEVDEKNKVDGLVRTILQALSEVNTQYSSFDNDDIPNTPQNVTVEKVTEILCTILIPDDAKTISDICEEIVEPSIGLTKVLQEVKIPETLSSKLMIVNKSRLYLLKSLSDEELPAAMAISSAQEWKDALVTIFDIAKKQKNAVYKVFTEVPNKDFEYLWSWSPSDTGISRADREKSLKKKRLALLRDIIPMSKDRLYRTCIQEKITQAVPEVAKLDKSVRLKLFQEICKTEDETSILEFFCNFLVAQSHVALKSEDPKFDIMIFANKGDSIGLPSKSTGSLILDLEDEKFEIPPGSSFTIQNTVTCRLYSQNALLSTIVYSNSGVTSSFSVYGFCTTNLFSQAKDLLRQLTSTTKQFSKWELKLDEILYFLQDPSSWLRDLGWLREYDAIKFKFRIKSEDDTRKLVNFLLATKNRTCLTGPKRKTSLIEDIHNLTKWKMSDIEEAMKLKFWTSNEKDVLAIGRPEDLLRKLNEVISISEKLGVSVSTVIDWTTLRRPLEFQKDFQNASKLQRVLSASKGRAVYLADEFLRLSKREVLTRYILQQEKIQKLEIKHADNLFEYFLIDVQMGPQLQTSRIKQAAATIQLFVQRCILGLEKKYKVPNANIDLKRWAWTSRFQVWVACRKIFLYPENWIEPTLRTNKSEIFMALESEILQSNLDLTTINGILRKYIYQVHQISDLEVQGYLWEPIQGFRGNYHFFARTRTAPFSFYYRCMKTSGANAVSVERNWYPWVKMDLDVPVIQVDATSKQLDTPGTYLIPALFNRRLYLFIPQIVVQSFPDTPASTTNEELAKRTANQIKYKVSYDIKIGWTELRNGVWTPKQISQSALTLSDADFAQASGSAPNVTDFKFWVRSRKNDMKDDVLIIDVEQWFDKTETVPAPAATPTTGATPAPTPAQTTRTRTVQWFLGRYEMKGDNLLRVDGSSAIGNRLMDTVQSKFSKLEYSAATSNQGLLTDIVQQWEVGGADNIKCPLFTLPTPDENITNHTIVWTMSFNEYQDDRATALVAERITGSKVEAFFGYPSIDDDGQFAKRNVTAAAQSLEHFASQQLMKQVTFSDDLEAIFSTLEKLPTDSVPNAFGQRFESFREMARPTSIYNWELGFHSILLIMERLLSAQQFELALEVAHFVFDPSVEDKIVQKPAEDKGENQTTEAPSQPLPADKSSPVATTSPSTSPQVQISPSRDSTETSSSETNPKPEPEPTNRLQNCWHFPPFKSDKLRSEGSTSGIINDMLPGKANSNYVYDWLETPNDPHAVARGRPVTYMKRFMVKYIEILIASGDYYFRQNSLETLPLALQRYIEASQLFGPQVQMIPSKTTRKPKRYMDIVSLLTDFGTANVDMELEFPFFSFEGFGSNNSQAATLASAPSLGIVKSPYFVVPPNPQMSALRDRIDDRFYKIRNSLDINGNFLKYSLFEPAIDPGALLGVDLSSPGSVANFLAHIDGPMPNYRFQYLLQKAFEITNELKAHLDTYVSIRERQDAEGLSRLQATQGIQIQKLTLDLKQLTKREAEKTIEVLKETRSSHAMRLKYFLDLAGESSKSIPDSESSWDDIVQSIDKPTDDDLRMSRQEAEELNKSFEASRLVGAATVIENICAVLSALPKLHANVQPMGVGVSTQMDTTIISSGLSFAASVLRAKSQVASDESNRASKKAQLIRQLQDRRHQANTAGRDIKNVDKQIEAQKIKIASCDADIRAQQAQLDHANELDQYLKSKYTKKELYGYMDKSVRGLAYETYLLAIDIARKAEKAFLFERCPGQFASAKKFLQTSYWDDSRDGAYAAQNLTLDLRRLEIEYMSKSNHDFEIVKNVSLRQIDPWALLRLQYTKTAEFQIPEYIFDCDFPGHYCRRIKSVSLTVPCVVGPYTNLGCTLKLLDHRYRMRMKLPNAKYYPEHMESDERFLTDKVPISAIAVSSGQQDSGQFELNFQAERWIPFEGAGAVSRWRIDLSPISVFDYTTISDVIIQLKFTALDGGEGWRQEAAQAVSEIFNPSGEPEGTDPGYPAFFDLKNELPDQWLRFTTTKDPEAEISLDSLKNRMPVWARGKTVVVQKVWLILDKGKTEWSLDTKDAVELVGLNATESSEKLGNLMILEQDPNESLGGDTTLEGQKVVFKNTLKSGLKFDRMWILFRYTVK